MLQKQKHFQALLILGVLSCKQESKVNTHFLHVVKAT